MTVVFSLESTTMVRVLVLICCVAIGWASGASVGDVSSRIAGGVEVDIKDYPYQASLQTSGFHICGAVILSEEWAATAADCAGGQITTYTLRVGSSVRGSGGSVHQVEARYIHPEYNLTVDYDIALLRLVNTSYLEFGPRVDKIAMAAQGQVTEDGAEATITGWGAAGPDGIVTSMMLQVIRLPVVSAQACKDVYGDELITDRTICAGEAQGSADACQGDTGGPMVVDDLLVGVVSRRRRCAETGVPGIYTRISSMRDWIDSVTGITL